MTLRVTPLGGARSVGRSCILVEIGASRALLDCGVGMSRQGDGRNLPDFSPLLGGSEGESGRDINDVLDVVLVTHFHLDHTGALPYLTEVLGYHGPVVMTHPTRAIAPMILEDHLHLTYAPRGLTPPYSLEQLHACFARVSCVQLRERQCFGPGDELSVTPFYAGHVLGAVMLLLECRGQSVLYTGDFTMTPDHHLSAAHLPLSLHPDVLISESTFSTTIRSSKRAKELEVCRKIQETLEKGGKVLVPTFAIGRAQELCLLCEKHWARAGLRYPIFIGKGMVEKALAFFRLFASWSSQSIRKDENPFHFPHVQTYESQSTDLEAENTPMVMLAGQSMLNGGLALEAFKRWAPNPKNLVIIPGYCLPGTLGNEVVAGAKTVNVGSQRIDVRCQVEFTPHSDHTDARGILQLIAQVSPRHVILVHGTESQMDTFRDIVQHRLRVPCFAPSILEKVDLSDLGSAPTTEVHVSPKLLKDAMPSPLPRVPGDSAFAEMTYAASFSGLLVKKKRRRDHDSTPAWELRSLSPESLRAAGGRELKRHVLRARHEEPSLELAAFQRAWPAIAEALQLGGIEHGWDPSPPPLEGIAKGAEHTVSFLSLRCTLRGATKKVPHTSATATWSLRDERESATGAEALRQLLDVIGAG